MILVVNLTKLRAIAKLRGKIKLQVEGKLYVDLLVSLGWKFRASSNVSIVLRASCMLNVN